MRSIDWYVFQVSWDTSRSLLSGNSLIRAEQEPDPIGLVRLDLFRADSKSSISPPNWNSLFVYNNKFPEFNWRDSHIQTVLSPVHHCMIVVVVFGTRPS